MERKIERILTGLYQKNILKKYQIIPTETEKVFYISVSFLPTDRPDRNMLTAGFLWNMTGVPLEENDLNIFDDGNEFENMVITDVHIAAPKDDKQLKIDLIFTVGYSYKGEFDNIDDIFTSLIGVQVKSSEFYQAKHIEKNKFVPSLVVSNEESDNVIKEKFVDLLHFLYKYKILQLFSSIAEETIKPQTSRRLGAILMDDIAKHIHV